MGNITQILQQWPRLCSVSLLCGNADRCYDAISKRSFMELHCNNITILWPGQTEAYLVLWKKNKKHKQTKNTKIQVSYGCLCISLFWKIMGFG